MNELRTRPIAADRIGELERLLGASGAEALLVLAEDSRDPDLAPFVGGALLGRSVLVVADGIPNLLCLTPMEREEAAATGLDLFDPATLGLAEIEGRSSEPNEFFAGAAYAALTSVGRQSTTVAITGRAPAGVTLRLRDRLGGSWEAVDGGELLRAWRRKKSREELEDCRRAAGIAGQAMRRVAALLAAAVPHADELWLEGERLTVGRLRR
ncbi:MAG TPA: hypothetical protein VKA53_10410, partial [Thermoanaerobaculia bacterium]|nr:hypothetical protein [Thermoanaerobaculia bacterium]